MRAIIEQLNKTVNKVAISLLLIAPFMVLRQVRNHSPIPKDELVRTYHPQVPP